MFDGIHGHFDMVNIALLLSSLADGIWLNIGHITVFIVTFFGPSWSDLDKFISFRFKYINRFKQAKTLHSVVYKHANMNSVIAIEACFH